MFQRVIGVNQCPAIKYRCALTPGFNQVCLGKDLKVMAQGGLTNLQNLAELKNAEGLLGRALSGFEDAANLRSPYSSG